MKVALLTAKPNWLRRVGGQKLYVGEKRPPHGLGFMYTILRNAGFQVDLYDRYCGDLTWPKDDFASYDFLGLYTTSVCSTDIERIVTKAKAARIAVGGPHAHLFPESFPDRVHHIVRGESEKIIVDLVNGRISERIITPPRLSDEELDEVPRFPWEFFYNEKHDNYDWGFHFNDVKPVFTMNTSRGCPFQCSFCSVKSIWGRKLTAMSAERVFDDIRYVHSLGARGLYFREDNFTARKARLRKLCELLVQSGLDLRWACETRVDTVDDETMALMQRAGCIGFYIGVESLSQHMLDVFQKQVKVEQIVKFFESANKYGMFTHASFIVEHPEETRQDRGETERLMDVIKPSFIVRNRYRPDG